MALFRQIFGLMQLAACIFLLIALAAAPVIATPLVFQILHAFSAASATAPYPNSDGANSQAALIQGGDGNFYGTTTYGGSSGEGTVFKITPAGTLTTLVDFNGANGACPVAALALGSDGNFYGTTAQGGASGSGVVFKVTPTGTLTTLHAFSAMDGTGDNADGADPVAALVLGSDGNFYGTAAQGGSSGDGAVFEVTPTGTLTTIHAFSAVDGTGDNADGADPSTGLIFGSDGSLYGTTNGGGNFGYGIVFSLRTSGTLTDLADFTNANGSQPNALTLGRDGEFYGTTVFGGSTGFGTAFTITPLGVLTTLVDFDDVDNGGNPSAGLIQGTDGNFYGTDYDGGVNGNGMVFSMTAPGTVTALYSFSAPTSQNPYLNSDGAYPVAGLIQDGAGSYYGTTQYGGPGGTGTVFALVPVSVPVITSFMPASGSAGSVVTIKGSHLGNLGGVTGVRFHNASAAVYTVNGAGTQLKVTVPANAATGPITVTTLGGSATTTAAFTVPAPLITSFSPASGPAGTVVKIKGTSLKGTTGVRFHNASAIVYTVNGVGTQLTVTVPVGAATGPITVTTPAGSGSTPTPFAVSN